MEISRIESIPVRVPLKPGLTTKTAHGEHVVSSYVMVKVHTDEGILGLGEATVAPRWSGETSRSCVAAIEDILAPAVTGMDPRQINLVRARMQRVLKGNPFTKAALEMAMWDIAGKAAGLPVHQLLGGAVREAIPVKMVVGAFDVPRAVALARTFLELGARCLKVKAGGDPAMDIERVRAIRALAGSEIAVGIDANGGWSAQSARHILHELEVANLLFVEQPIPPGSLTAWQSLRPFVRASLMADESIFSLGDAWTLAQAGAVDLLSVYPGKHGGIWETMEIVHVSQAAGLACHMGSNLELGVGTAAMLHVAAALPGIDSEAFPSDIIGPLYHETCLLRQPLKISHALAEVPTGPGLGVELDEIQLSRFREN